MDFILDHSWSPLLLICLVIAFSWLWEDGALIVSALLAADARLGVYAALVAIFIGICSGDMMLYALGRVGRRWRWMRYRLLKNKRVRKTALGFRRRIWTNIFIVRFIPGLRTVGFTSCGYWRINWLTFFTAMSIAGVFWIVLMFSIVYRLGNTSTFSEGYLKWSLMVIAVLLLVVNNLLGRWLRNRKMIERTKG